MFQIPVCRRDHPGIHFDVLQATHTLELLMIQECEDLCLHGEGKFPDLIQEHGSACCQLDQTFLRLHRARKGPPLIAKELALHQMFRNCAAVDADHQVVPPVAAGMDQGRCNLFSGSGLAPDQNIHRGILSEKFDVAPDPHRGVADSDKFLRFSL